jgi:hypothetical protein
VSPLDPPAAAARRQYVIDRVVEDLVDWGCPPGTAEHRARQLLDHVAAAGYTLPVALQGAPPAGGGSTEEGRRAARAVFEATRRQGHAPPDSALGAPHRGGRVSQHPPEAPGATERAGR